MTDLTVGEFPSRQPQKEVIPNDSKFRFWLNMISYNPTAAFYTTIILSACFENINIIKPPLRYEGKKNLLAYKE